MKKKQILQILEYLLLFLSFLQLVISYISQNIFQNKSVNLSVIVRGGGEVHNFN